MQQIHLLVFLEFR